MRFGLAGFEEAAVDIVDQIGGAEIEVGADGGHVGRGEAGEHETAQRGREVVHHDPDVGAFCAALRGGRGGKKHERDQRGGDPGPGAQSVVGDVEPEGGADAVLFILGAEDALGDVAAAAGFGTGVPGGPPVEAHEDEEGEEEAFSGVGHEGECAAAVMQGVIRVYAGGELMHAAERVDGKDGEQNDHRHFEHELDEVCPEHGPQAGDGVVGEREQEAGEDGGELRARRGEAECEGEDLDHGEVDPAHDDGVDGEREIERAEAAQEGGGAAGVTELGEFDIGEDLGASPERSEEEDGEHAGESEAPPEPVAGDALLVDEAGDDEGGVCAEGGGHHGCAGQPPGNAAAGEEELTDVARRAPHVIEADGEVEGKVERDDKPVDCGEFHRESVERRTQAGRQEIASACDGWSAETDACGRL